MRTYKPGEREGGVSAHTPTPWRLIPVTADDEYPTPNVGDHRLAGADDISPGIIFGGYPTLSGVDGNAAFIVEACNAHDALVADLSRLRAVNAGLVEALRQAHSVIGHQVKRTPYEPTSTGIKVSLSFEQMTAQRETLKTLDAALAQANAGER